MSQYKVRFFIKHIFRLISWFVFVWYQLTSIMMLSWLLANLFYPSTAACFENTWITPLFFFSMPMASTLNCVNMVLLFRLVGIHRDYSALRQVLTIFCIFLPFAGFYYFSHIYKELIKSDLT